jgi:hypothetical protein
MSDVANDPSHLPETALITREHAIAAATNALRNQGYALAVHGTQLRDLDLIAIPWRETALGPRQVAEIVAAAVPGVVHWPFEKMPHGRVSVVIYPRWRYGFDHWYIDLSVMPRRRKRGGGAPSGETPQ